MWLWTKVGHRVYSYAEFSQNELNPALKQRPIPLSWFSILQSWNLCVCACECAHICRGLHAYTLVHACGGQRLIVRCFLLLPFTLFLFFWTRGLSLNMELSDSGTLASQQPPHICIFLCFLSTTVAGAWLQSLVFLWLLGNHTQICMLAEHVLCWLSHTTPGNSVCIFSKKMLTLAFFSAVILLWESTKRSPLRQTQSLSSLPPCLSGSNYTSRLFSSASEISLLIPHPAPLWNVTFSLLSFKLPAPFQLSFPTTNMPSL